MNWLRLCIFTHWRQSNAFDEAGSLPQEEVNCIQALYMSVSAFYSLVAPNGENWFLDWASRQECIDGVSEEST